MEKSASKIFVVSDEVMQKIERYMEGTKLEEQREKDREYGVS